MPTSKTPPPVRLDGANPPAVLVHWLRNVSRCETTACGLPVSLPEHDARPSWSTESAEVTCPVCYAVVVARANPEVDTLTAPDARELSDADLDMDAGLEELPAKLCRCGRPVIYKLTDLRTLADTAICPACSLAPTACACDPGQLKQLDADATEEHGPAPTGAQAPSGDGPATWPPVPGTLPARLVYAARALAAVEASLRGAVDDLQARAMLPLELTGILELLAGAEAKAAFARSGLVRLALMVTASVRQGVL